ncbi:MAG: formate acetyltransferase [Spirochaetes bacterium DG_61]|nr:MAG: formate acetyltransferase [Spirochaetes bacterium DG_61]
MTERVKLLKKESYESPVILSIERAELITDFYRENYGKYTVPEMRALSLKYLCEKKTIYIGEHELIVGERGPFPKAVPTYPELTCHSVENLEILGSRKKTCYLVTRQDVDVYREKIIPYWRGRTMRDRIFRDLTEEWKDVYTAGIFTEFMEQRAPGHTTLDGKFYNKGLLDFKEDIGQSIFSLDFKSDPEATSKLSQLRAMDIACDAVILFAERHAVLAEEMAQKESDSGRKKELQTIASNCCRVPARAPVSFWEALQIYWFIHLGTIIELNGWDAMNPGHLDRYLYPFYKKDIEEGRLTKEQATELLECFWIKFNNHPAPPKVGVTAAESGTYNDFTNINLGGVLADGSDSVNELSYLMLEVMDEIHLLQPQGNIQLSRKNPDRFLKAACRVIRKGYGYPSIFNADAVIEEMIRGGKSIEDAREGGTSGCVETGAFGKEAYILTGYLNTPKILEITLHNGVDPMTGKRIGLETGDPREFSTFDELFDAFRAQLHHFVDIKVRGNQYIERMYAEYAPAVFLSVLIDDCIIKGKDYNDGGPRYNTTYIQCVGIGTITDSLSSIKKHAFEEGNLTMEELIVALDANFEDRDDLRLLLANKTPRYGNDDDYADSIMLRVFTSLYNEIEGRPNTRGGEYHIVMLPTTCHIYFGSVMGASADGRRAKMPLSEGISPVQGADRKGPTSVLKSAGKMDHLKTGGTLLNMKFMPRVLEGEKGIDKLAQLVRTYFRYDAHHVQFNVVDADTLRRAQVEPEEHRDLIVRVAGYSDYFCDLGSELQEEIISRTAQGELS